MQKYIKKPIPVEALELTPALLRDHYLNNMPIEGFEVMVDNRFDGELFYLNVHTLEAHSLRANEGCWLIKGPFGEYWPVQGNIFKETYAEYKG